MQTLKLVLLLFVTVASLHKAIAQSSSPKGEDMAVIEATLESIGKCPPSHNIKFGNLDKKYITTALYVQLGNSDQATPIPINDKVFDYNEFNKSVYPAKLHQKVKITARRFTSKGKDVYLAYEVK
jgi:hypothetical protein